MAAVLKKRALAEYTQVIQEEAPKPKKLRLIHKPAVVPLNLHSLTTPQEVFNALVEFSNNSSSQNENTARESATVLVDHFYKSQESHIRAKILSVLGQLVQSSQLEASFIIDDVLAMMKSEESHNVIAQILRSLTDIGKQLTDDLKLRNHLMEIAILKLKNSHYLVRCRSLDLIGVLGTQTVQRPDDSQSKPADLFKILREFTLDQDPRVRTSAFHAIATCHERGLTLDVSIYQPACQALCDDYEGVRVAATKLVCVFSQLQPNRLIKVSETSEELRLVDDAFAKVCNMVNDSSMRVRTEAARLMGSMKSVSSKFLEQTLDKKLMSNMRRKTSSHERQKDHYMSGEWSTGKKWADDAPKEGVDPDTVSLISSGACGAFVHGLEDEFLEVRHAAIDSLSSLACQSPSFAQLSQDFLLDMFNDEIESVRLSAINSLTRLGRQLVLREDQLEVILGCMKDFSYEIRESLREMFCQTRLSTKECLNQCMLALLDNLKRYPQDKQPIWECMQHIGSNHPSLTLPLVPELLSTHPYFDTPEPDMDDPAYVSVLLLVFNAAENSPTMMSLFPDHTFRHYQYLRNSLPDMVPHLQIPHQEAQCPRPKQETHDHVTDFLSQTIHRLEIANNLDTDSVQELLRMVVRDLERISEVDPSLAATTECTAMFLQCQLLLSQNSRLGGTSGTSDTSTRIEAALDRVLHLTSQLRHLFIGLTPSELCAAGQLRLRAKAVQIIHNPKSRHNLCEAFLNDLKELQQFTMENHIKPELFIQAILFDYNKLNTSKLDCFVSTIQNALKHQQKFGIQLANRVQRLKVTINEPIENVDNPIKFTAGLTLSIPVDAVVENATNLENLRIQVIYPDKRRQLTRLRDGDSKKMSGSRHRLVSHAVISHAVWAEPCCVEVNIVSCSDAPSTDMKADSKNSFLELCNPVKVLVAPKAVKKF